MTRYVHYLSTEHGRYMLFTRRCKRSDGIIPLLANSSNIRNYFGYSQEIKLIATEWRELASQTSPTLYTTPRKNVGILRFQNKETRLTIWKPKLEDVSATFLAEGSDRTSQVAP